MTREPPEQPAAPQRPRVARSGWVAIIAALAIIAGLVLWQQLKESPQDKATREFTEQLSPTIGVIARMHQEGTYCTEVLRLRLVADSDTQAVTGAVLAWLEYLEDRNLKPQPGDERYVRRLTESCLK